MAQPRIPRKCQLPAFDTVIQAQSRLPQSQIVGNFETSRRGTLKYIAERVGRWQVHARL
jgi:hypothetical protein